jgi:CHRD domain/PEP-CTERM motif
MEVPMFRLRTFVLVTLVLVFAGSQANAATLFTANLTGDQENPDVPTAAFGFGTFVLNDAMTQLSIDVTISGIDVTGTQTPQMDDNLVAAHIHSPAPIGMNAGVVWGFFGTPFNDINQMNLLTPFSMGAGGRFVTIWDAPEGNGGTTLTAHLGNLFNDLTYINFHTVEFGGGEIRGQILTPEPTTLTLLGLGLLGFGGRVVRRKRAS